MPTDRCTKRDHVLLVVAGLGNTGQGFPDHPKDTQSSASPVQRTAVPRRAAVGGRSLAPLNDPSGHFSLFHMGFSLAADIHPAGQSCQGKTEFGSMGSRVYIRHVDTMIPLKQYVAIVVGYGLICGALIAAAVLVGCFVLYLFKRKK